jgi:hypothetical protein
MLLGGVLGITIGIILGLGFSLIIAWIAGHIQPGNTESIPPVNIASFLGMGFGAVVGGIMGGVVFSKKQ